MIAAGLDGYPRGWVVAIGPIDAPACVSIGTVASLAALFESNAPAFAAVDIPIGLPGFAGPGGRAAEVAARALLGGRQSSVFSTPCRAAVYATSYAEACALNQANSHGAKKVSKQSHAIAKKIKEADELLHARHDLRPRLRETHPEVAFRFLKGEPLARPKKIKGRVDLDGIEERRALLRRAGLSEAAMQARPAGAGIDDVTDALACWLVAARIARGEAAPLPSDPPVDAFGIACAIWI